MHSFVPGTQEAARLVNNYLVLSLGKIQSFHKSGWSLPALPTTNKQVEIMSIILPLLPSMTNFQLTLVGSECHLLSFSVQRGTLRHSPQSAHKGAFPQHPVNAGRTIMSVFNEVLRD